MTITTIDGLALRGRTPEEIIEELRATSRSPGRTTAQFMDEMASRTLLLTGHRVRTKLVFRGVADVIFHPTEKCVGGLWEITRACERALDRYEGVSAKLYRKVYLTIKRRGQPSEESVLVYVMNSDGIMPPFDDYLAVIERGYRDFGLDLAYLGRAVEHAYEAKDRTPDLERRYERKGRPRLAQRERRAS
jgi:hypothetical protein